MKIRPVSGIRFAVFMTPGGTMDVRHDEKESRFVADLEGDDAYISYDRPDEKTIDLLHTIVPEAHEGKGVASALARYALDYARQNDLRVVPSCQYVSSWLERHPEYQDVTGRR